MSLLSLPAALEISMNEPADRPYQFPCPPDYNWLPSRFPLFDGLTHPTATPTARQIEAECAIIRLSWDDWETSLRSLRAEMACQYGICRNG